MTNYQYAPFSLDVRRKDVRIITTNKDFVEWALSLNTHNRPVKTPVVAEYADQMRRGYWELTSQGIGFSADGFLADGQHRLLANREAGYPPIETTVVTGCTAMSQAKVDAHAKRTMANAIGLAKDIWLSNWICATVRYIGKLNGRPKMCVEDVYDTYLEYADAFEAVKPYPKEAPQSAGFTAAIVYGVYNGATSEKAMQFLVGVADGVGLGRNDPRLAMRKYIEKRRQYKVGKGIVAQDLYFCATARAFYAWVKNRPLITVKQGESRNLDVNAAADLLRNVKKHAEFTDDPELIRGAM